MSRKYKIHPITGFKEPSIGDEDFYLRHKKPIHEIKYDRFKPLK
jgi:hypothetical protein